MIKKYVFLIALTFVCAAFAMGQKTVQKFPADSIVILSPLIRIVKVTDTYTGLTSAGPIRVSENEAAEFKQRMKEYGPYDYVANTALEARANKIVLLELQKLLGKDSYINIPILPQETSKTEKIEAVKSIMGGHFSIGERPIKTVLTDEAKYSLLTTINNTFGAIYSSRMNIYIIDNRLRKFVHISYHNITENLGNSKNVSRSLSVVLQEYISGLH